ncbi:toluene-4-monooxygenase system protein B [Sulfobacillus acidophilus TPY]|uniref:Toluene 4-monooxygenase protein B n=1 Tax=Sulfobacillus acidophilus (strain ATCC 700253 / DSM 10332 / NAL) TaxID=679936 RepID=G8U0C1_SULAD|nr:toluene-4-monooxygenase system protein B [Sulfobacillus acidophilus TPY]AEW06463.1 toluene 4-monooxygenase protein B [Sulfobacillus acidophilus DSM 10332]
MVPLVGVFEGDFVAQLFVVEIGDPMSAVAEKLAVHAVNLRVMPEDRPLEVVKDGQPLPDSMTVREAGLQPMDVVRVRYR